jgi:hypothetical protein
MEGLIGGTKKEQGQSGIVLLDVGGDTYEDKKIH